MSWDHYAGHYRAQVTNQGLIEATNNGVLNIDGITINNQGGTISANGAGASVQLFGNADIQGGTLTNNGAAFFGTPNGKRCHSGWEHCFGRGDH